MLRGFARLAVRTRTVVSRETTRAESQKRQHTLRVLLKTRDSADMVDERNGAVQHSSFQSEEHFCICSPDKVIHVVSTMIPRIFCPAASHL